MARSVVTMNLYSWRFFARFWREVEPQGDPVPDKGLGFQTVAHTPYGLEFWSGHQIGEPLLMTRIGEMKSVQVVFMAREPDETSRIITYRIGEPKSCPVLLDARDSTVALDGIIFGKAEVLSVEDKVLSDPERLDTAEGHCPISGEHVPRRLRRAGLDRGER